MAREFLFNLIRGQGCKIDSANFEIKKINTGFVLSMEYLQKYGIQLAIFKVMNSMKFRVAVWKSMDFGEFCRDFFGRY